MKFSDIRALASRGYSDSVVRRSFVLLCLMGPAFAINLALYYVAARLLSANSFGLFYIAVTAGNVLYSGSTVINIFFTHYIVIAIQTSGKAAAYAAWKNIHYLIARWGVFGFPASILILFGIGKWIGVESWSIIVLIVLDAFTAYLIDVDRALLQSLRKTVALGSLTLAWMALRFLLGVAGMALFKTAWAGLLGAILAAVLILVVLSAIFSARLRANLQLVSPLPPLRALLAVICGYGSLILVSNLDVLLTYLLLGDSSVGAYSASSVFPKGILVVITPLLQMLYPTMVGRRKAAAPHNMAVLQKCAAVIFLLSGAIGLSVFLFSGVLCGGTWGLRLCQPDPLGYLLISAVCLSVLRVLVFYESACARDWMSISMLVPAAAYVLIAAMSERSIETVALQFTVFSAGVLLYYCALTRIAERQWPISGTPAD